MAKDVLIIPGDALIQFSSSAGTGSGQILADNNNDLIISNLVGDVLLGDGASDVFIGDGTNNVDIVFEQNGEIRDDASGKSITLGSSTTNIFISGSNTIAMQKQGGNVGIGKTAATTTLEVEGDISGSGTGSFSHGSFTEKVGIGTTSPDNFLHISYNSSAAEGSVQNNTGAVGLQIENTNASGVAAIHLRSSDADGYIMYDDNGSNNGDFFFKTDGGDGLSVLTLKDNGNVGIGIESPGEKLTVQGNISASGNITASSYTGSFVGDGSGLTNVSATVADESITLAKLAHADANTVLVRDANSAGDPSFKEVTNTQILIGDGTGFTAAALSGDVTMTNAGVVSVADNKIGNSELKQDDDITLQSLTTTNNISGSTIEGQTLTADVFLSSPSASLTNITTTNITASGNISSSGNIIGELTGIGGAVTGITSLLATDIKIGEDDETKIDFETANEIHFYANNVEQVYLADNIFGPQSDSDVDLGASGVRWKDSYFDTVTTRNLTTTGPTTIGDGNDVIQFNPRILVQGDVTASGNFITQGHITASGNISASGQLIAASADFNDGNISSVGIIDLDTIRGDGDTNTNIAFGGDDTMTFKAGNEAMITLVQGGVAGDIVTIGDGGDIDFKVSTSGDNSTIFVQGSSDNVGIGTSTPGQKLEVVGNISGSGEITTHVGQHVFVKTSNTDADAKGDIVYLGGTTSMTAGKIYHYKSDGTWELADADAVATSDGLLAVALGAASDINGMLLRGTVTLDHDPGAVGDVLFLSTTSGQATATAPSGNTDIVRVIGYCLDASNGQIWFNPDNTFVEVSA